MPKSKLLFLIDGTGALVSAFMLGIVLVRFESYIGMPVQTLHFLAILAVVFAAYSLTCFVLSPQKWRPFLKLIALINSAYCLLTLFLVLYHLDDLSVPGVAYFLIEILIILFLVSVERKHANKG